MDKKPQSVQGEDPPSLRQKIGQMVMIGFRGMQATESDPIYKMVKEQGIGGVVLYNRDLPSSDSLSRNVESPAQLKKLNQQLQSISKIPLLIGIDEEGGRVSRLKSNAGFLDHRSHQRIGDINNQDSTKLWATNMAKELAALGINMNFAPVIDLNINQENPIIGGLERSFSPSVGVVVNNAKTFVDAHESEGVICVPKHFPGHGSSQSDTHLGLADVTNTWSEEELKPFKELLPKTGIIMTSHVYNEKLDSLPATLSPKIIQQLLRNEFGFEGVILSDDLHMRAISNFYDQEAIVLKAINAGVDMLMFSCNASPCSPEKEGCVDIPFDPMIGAKVVDKIEALVKSGQISEARINESYGRIMRLKEKL